MRLIGFVPDSDPPVPILRFVSWRDRLRRALDESGKKHSAVARDAGITPATLSRILTATHAQPGFDTIVRIARAIDENVGWLLDEPGYSLSAHEQRQLREAVRMLDTSLHAVARVRRGARPEPNAFPAGAPNREIPRPFAALGARLIYEAAGDSMLAAGIADRDLLYVKPSTSTREANGRIVVCRVAGADYVKQLDLRASRIRLLSRDIAYPPIELHQKDDDFELIGIVVGRTGAVAA